MNKISKKAFNPIDKEERERKAFHIKHLFQVLFINI